MDIEFLLVLIVFVIGGFLLGSSLPAKYRNRSCEGKEWKVSFPEARKEDIREFLSLFVGAFAFNENDKLKFNPNDELLEIYKNLYPHQWQADSMEFETLADDLKKEFDIKFEEIWHEKLTLGELFRKVW